MVLMSQTIPSRGIRAEILLCKSGSVTNNTRYFRHKTSTVSFPWDLSKTTQNMCVDANGVKSRRGNKAIVAASPPTDDAVVSTEPLTKEDLVAYLSSGCKPKENWRFLFVFMFNITY